MKPRILHIKIEEDIPSAKKWLFQKIKLIEAQELLNIFRLGALYVDDKRVTDDLALKPGQVLRLHLDPKRYAVSKINWTKRIVYEDSDFLVINKPAGVPVHATLDNCRENVLFQLNECLGEEILLTHRLDVSTGGLMVYAKTKKFQAWFNKQIAAKKIRKVYRALTIAAPTRGQHVHYMNDIPKLPKEVSRKQEDGWLYCALDILDVIPLAADRYDLKIELLTGRTHQIRAQLNDLGCGLIEDNLYPLSEPRRDPPMHLPLMSFELGFDGLEKPHSFTLTEKDWQLYRRPFLKHH